MGYYSSISIDEIEIFSEKRVDPPGLDVLFSKHDQRTLEPDDEEGDLEWDTIAADINLARFRLNINGYSLIAARKAYGRWEEFLSEPPDYPELFVPAEPSRRIFEDYSFEEYLDLLLARFRSDAPEPTPEEELLFSEAGGYYYHFPHEDHLMILAALIHAVPASSVKAVMPVDDDRVSLFDSRDQLTLLTEGRTDARYLKKAFELVRPEYARELKFLDHDFRPPAGTGEVVRLLKSLAALGTTAPLLAIFDNDTAGHLALEEARKIELPDNFRLATYPDIELARNYPTLGPSGMQSLDVNGKACGLELYLGEDVLMQDGSLSPVRWTGYEDRMQRYQGEVSHKINPNTRVTCAAWSTVLARTTAGLLS